MSEIAVNMDSLQIIFAGFCVMWAIMTMGQGISAVVKLAAGHTGKHKINL